MDLIDALEQTFHHTEVLISNVGAEQYDSPTPCPEWTVRDLLDHTIRIVSTLGAAASGARPEAFVLGTDPAAQFRAAADAALTAWRTPGTFDQVIVIAAGPMLGSVVAGINLLDTATHAWDIARATGQPAELPNGVAEAALEASRAFISPELRPGRFGPQLQSAAGTTPTEQLVAFLGRQP
jgi:uncharacterized protein (TIGR03086 family)